MSYSAEAQYGYGPVRADSLKQGDIIKYVTNKFGNINALL